MCDPGHATQAQEKRSRYSYWFMGGLAVLIVWLHLATPLLSALFAYLALERLEFPRRGGKTFALRHGHGGADYHFGD